LPDDEPQFGKDVLRLCSIRAVEGFAEPPVSDGDRSLHRALVELTVARPLGDLLDIGCGHGRILKLLASRAQRAVGVDIDSNARRLARASLLLAGTPNTTLRHGNMIALPFKDAEFDTVILDDVLAGAQDPGAALDEALRILDPRGQIILLASIVGGDDIAMRKQFGIWATAANLRLAQPRSVPSKNPSWLLAVATAASSSSAAA
jgi:ubiquinone/menaquinone biosynthesis C-methylase UbiE